MLLKRRLLRWTSVATLMCIAVGAQTTAEGAPAATTDSGDHFEPQFSGTEPPVDPAGARGGRGPEHCALAVGIFLGGALGFFANPFVGSAFMRLGFMAAALHCA